MSESHPQQPPSRFRPRFGLVVALIAGAALYRVIPHPPNVSPVAAMALFGGASFVGARWALAIPLAAMLLSDVALELLFGWGIHSLMPVVYGCFALTVCLGWLLRRQRSPLAIAAASVAASTLFFVVTNAAVWATSAMYPPTAAGLLACYTAALPFYGATLAGDLLFTAALFSTAAMSARAFPALRARAPEVPAA